MDNEQFTAEQQRLAQESAAAEVKAEEDRQQQIAELTSNLKGEPALAETVENDQGSAEAVKPIEERLEAPQTRVFEQYGETMRKDAEELLSTVKARDEKYDEVVALGGGQKNPELWAQYMALKEKGNILKEKVVFGTSPDEKNFNAYKETAMSDPIVVLRLAESGNFGANEGVEKISSILRGNTEYMERILDVLPASSAQFFWRGVEGEAGQDKDLYIAAIRKNSANYQFGSDELKKDPEVHAAALAAGLHPVFLNNYK